MCPDDGTRIAGWRARLDLAFERRGGRTVLAERRHDGPLVVQKALYPEGDATCHAIVVHPPAGIAGGDELDIAIAARAGSHAVLTTPGAGKWYRSAGPFARQHVTIQAHARACFEWLPQETILFDASRARIAWSADLAADASLIAWDIYCLGRTGSGEGFDRGEASIETRIRRGGRLAWVERARIEPQSTVRASAAGLAHRTVFGTLLASAPSIDRTMLDACRAESPLQGEASVTSVPGVLVGRYRGDSSEAARRYFVALWKRLREPFAGIAAQEPRIWRT